MKRGLLLAVAVCIGIFSFGGLVFSAGSGDIRKTKHNFSATGAGSPIQNIHATTETQVCVFCHTPHRALTNGPLWNHSMSTVKSYTLYHTSTLLSPLPAGNMPDGDSLLCLSCHDGDQPIGAVQNVGGLATTISMTGTNLSGGKLIGPTSFGSILDGHHPISIEISDCLRSNKTTECPTLPIAWKLQAVIDPDYLKATANRYTPPIGYTCATADHPGTGVQCSSCHDAHSPNWMFLRVPDSPTDPWGNRIYSDTLCLKCHVACP
ncbi:MAG: hypothetical protein M0Z71_01335 [Nitrospiraceae bacterium]|nr:hypothetical protein [Nitrospiraceae bacterium]